MPMLRLIRLFFRPAGLDFAAHGSGILGGLIGMANAQSIPHANFNIPGNAPAIDAMWNEAMRAIQSSVDRNTGMVDPTIVSSYSKLLGIDPSILVQAGMAAGNQYAGLSGIAGGYSDILGNQALQQFGAGADIYNLGRDPQNQLHDYMRSQVTDASRAADSARGVGMSPYSAGNEMDAQRKFEMDWQNNLLGRAATGLQGMNAANTLGGQDLSNSLAIGANAPQFMLQAGQAPVQGQISAYSLPMDFANMFTQAQWQDVLGPQAALQQQAFPYIGMGNQAQQAQFGANLNSVLARNAMQQQAQYGLAGGGQNQGGNPYGNWGGTQSGAGNPMNYVGFGGGGGGFGA